MGAGQTELEVASAFRERGARLLQDGRYREAEAVLRRALTRREKAGGREHVGLVKPLLDLADCYKHLGRFVDSGLLYQRALRIAVRARRGDHSELASIYAGLGSLEYAAGNWLRGEPFARKALRLRQQALGRRHPLVAGDLTALGALLDRLGRHDEAARLHQRALSILERDSRPNDPLVGVVLGHLAAAPAAGHASGVAETLAKRALDIQVAALGPGHPQVGRAWSRLADVTGRGRTPGKAVPMFRRALRILRATLGAKHPDVGVCWERYSQVLARLRRGAAARAAARTSARIRDTIDAVNDDGVAVTGTVNPDDASFDLLTRRSPIHRLGVFAGEPIPPNRRVIEYTGERIAAMEGARRWDPARSYLFQLTRRWWLDGAIGGSGAEYINHSCEPNINARILRGHILYFSNRPIAEGEELTVDYQYAHDTDEIHCHCGAATCRGLMNLSREEARARRARRLRGRG